MTILSKVTLANANSAQTVLYFFFLMLYKASTCKIFWLCAVVFFTICIHLRQIGVFSFFLSTCKSNIPLTSVIMNIPLTSAIMNIPLTSAIMNIPLTSAIMNLKQIMKRKHNCDHSIELFYAILSILYIDKTGST